MVNTAKYTKELIKLFSSSENIVLISHINPDGDAIGSQLALYFYLKSIGRNAVMITPNNLQEFLKWMKGSELINVFIKDRQGCKKIIESADLFVLLDFNQPDRLGEAEGPVIASTAKKVIIDHHLDPGAFGDLIISDPAKCATSELIYEMVNTMSRNKFISVPFAEALYVGIITDTSNFEHGNYSSRTFRIVADLLETGIEKEKILHQIYSNFSEGRLRLQGFALNQRMIILPEYNAAYIYLTRKDLNSFNYVKGDTEGFVNMPLTIKGVIFSTLFIEKDGFVKLSFRSRGNFRVNEFAKEYFSGGGHMNASGGEYPGSLEDTIRYFLDILKKDYNKFRSEE